MRAIERTTQFKRDFKREMKGRHRATLKTALTDVLRPLANAPPLTEKYPQTLANHCGPGMIDGSAELYPTGIRPPMAGGRADRAANGTGAFPRLVPLSQ
jgi:hypothetical protein